MEMAPYLSFKGDCEAAFALYERALGGRVGDLFRYGGSPMDGDVPARWQDKIMHGSMTVGGHLLMGADMAAVVPYYGSAPAAREDVLGRTVRHARRSIRHPVVDQLRRRRE